MAKNDTKTGVKITPTSGKYTAESITVLEGLEPVRKRPGMYIGTTGPDGLHHLITEIFDNSRDEAMGGFCSDIEIALLPQNWIRVVDNGRGIPIDIHKQTKVSALETIMTTLHAGAKFGGEGYKISGGLHGVGASVVNALSIYMKVLVHRDGGIYMQEYKQGNAKAKVKKVGSSKLHGTIVTFEPDPEIFPEIEFDFGRITSHMREQAYLVRGLRISVIDARDYEGDINDEEVFYFRELGLNLLSQSFYFEGGLVSLVKYLNQVLKPSHKNIFYTEKKVKGVESVEIALQYADDISSRILPFANNIYNIEGGMHVTGFKTALTRTINNYARKNNFVKDAEDNFTGDDVLEGLTVVISVKMREVQFEGQTKAKLGSVEARGAVDTIMSESFAAFLEENPDDAKIIMNKVILALKARKAAKAAKDSVLRKGALEGMTLPGKLADCETKSAEEAELFIVEGDSAGGCFDGDTKVVLVDGRNLSFKDLVKEYQEGKENYCYTVNNNRSIEIAKIENPRITKAQAETLKVVLDNDEEIICTPDHRFMLRDGSYREAKKLNPIDSLMPLRRQISRLGKRITIKGYELVFDPREHRWIFTHMLSDQYNQKLGLYKKEEGQHIHHIDFNKRNNNPNNLKRMGKLEHMLYHILNLDKSLHLESTKEKCRQIHKSKEHREKIRKIMNSPKMRKMLRARAKKQWENPSYKKFMLDKFLDFYNKNENYREQNEKRLNLLQKEYWGEEDNRKKQAERVKNYFSRNPKAKQTLRKKAEEEWNNPALLQWRSEKTKEQWTPDFRQKRMVSYNKTYLLKILKILRGIYEETGIIDLEKYNELRQITNDKSLIRPETAMERFFNNNVGKLEEAVLNFNHKIKKIVPLKTKTDVYDLEVKDTHNFALASGVFVHNSGKQGRDRRTQAVLPLKGKILNVERARLDRILGFEEIKNLVIALGAAVGDAFDISKLRYHKIIIATDADVDGAHIRTLLLTLFYRYFKTLIDNGFIFIAQPPLYKIKKGKEIFYAFSDEEKKKIVGDNEVGEESEEENEIPLDENLEVKEKIGRAKGPKVSIQRYKGLGEMNPEELWETTMDPTRRILRKITIEDAQEADKVFDILMGTDVPARKSFIQSNAQKANIDI